MSPTSVTTLRAEGRARMWSMSTATMRVLDWGRVREAICVHPPGAAHRSSTALVGG
jgi:hypothetical protein